MKKFGLIADPVMILLLALGVMTELPACLVLAMFIAAISLGLNIFDVVTRRRQ